MELVITIDLTSKAMEENREEELMLMFRIMQVHLHQGKTTGVLLDSNGQDAGDWEIYQSMHEMEPRK